MSFLDSVDFYADLRDQFIEAVGESKLGEYYGIGGKSYGEEEFGHF